MNPNDSSILDQLVLAARQKANLAQLLNSSRNNLNAGVNGPSASSQQNFLAAGNCGILTEQLPRSHLLRQQQEQAAASHLQNALLLRNHHASVSQESAQAQGPITASLFASPGLSSAIQGNETTWGSNLLADAAARLQMDGHQKSNGAVEDTSEQEMDKSNEPNDAEKAEDDNQDNVAEVSGSGQDEDDLTNETFPFKLYRMLTDTEENGNDNILSFTPSGRAFRIHKPEEFTAKIMPEYFSTSRLASFQRQLNLYGFRRIADGPEKGAYLHEHFRKGHKSLCRKIKRKKASNRLLQSDLFSSFGGRPDVQALSVRQMLANGTQALPAAQLPTIPSVQLQSLVQPNLRTALSLHQRQLLQQQQQQADLLHQLLSRR